MNILSRERAKLTALARLGSTVASPHPNKESIRGAIEQVTKNPDIRP